MAKISCFLFLIALISSCSFPIQVDYKIAPKIVLDLPIKCKFGKDCFIQRYVDHGKDNSMFDYGCHVKTTNNYDGTLFRLRLSKMVKDNVPVLAASKGEISRVCINPKPGDSNCPLKIMQELGNHIVIDHTNGWKTYYGHIKEKQNNIEIGKIVKKGQKIAHVGINKNTLLPVLDFRTLFNGYVVDPFVGTVAFSSCRYDIDPLWSEKAYKTMKYKKVSLLIGAFSSKTPTNENIVSGEHEIESLSDKLKKFHFWVEVLGTRKGDVEKIQIVDSKGNMLTEYEMKLKEYSDRHIATVTVNKPYEGWNEGEYTAYYTLLRDDRYVIVFQKQISLKN